MGKKWAQANPGKIKAIQDAWLQRHPGRLRELAQALRIEVLTYYGGDKLKCVCCGESEEVFLSIDHVNGGGVKHRQEINNGRYGGGGGSRIYRWLKRQGFPEASRRSA